MMGKVIQGSFLAGRPKLSVQPKAAPLPNRMIPPSASPRVMSSPVQARTVPRPPGSPAPAFVPPRPAAVQRHGVGDAFAVEAGSLGLTASGGRPLPEAVRGKMESALGADFSAVRVYVGPQAERIGAIAFTVGSDIYFAPGRYQPDTMQGQQLLGHELAHVVQQRAGRVRNPLGAGLAVVQDRALEAEADRLGQRAATHRVTVQAKRRPAAGHSSSPVRISQPITAGPGRYRLSAGTGGREIGSVMVHARDQGRVEVTDLGVNEEQRGNGVGRLLVVSAAKTGLQFGKSKVTLAAEDRGSGHLTRWYKDMGFTQTGVNQRGYPQLEAPISRLLGGTVQRKTTSLGLGIFQAAPALDRDVRWGGVAQHRQIQKDGERLRWRAAGIQAALGGVPWRLTAQLMDEKKTNKGKEKEKGKGKSKKRDRHGEQRDHDQRGLMKLTKGGGIATYHLVSAKAKKRFSEDQRSNTMRAVTLINEANITLKNQGESLLSPQVPRVKPFLYGVSPTIMQPIGVQLQLDVIEYLFNMYGGVRKGLVHIRTVHTNQKLPKNEGNMDARILQSRDPVKWAWYVYAERHPAPSPHTAPHTVQWIEFGLGGISCRILYDWWHDLFYVTPHYAENVAINFNDPYLPMEEARTWTSEMWDQLFRGDIVTRAPIATVADMDALAARSWNGGDLVDVTSVNGGASGRFRLQRDYIGGTGLSKGDLWPVLLGG